MMASFCGMSSVPSVSARNGAATECKARPVSTHALVSTLTPVALALTDPSALLLSHPKTSDCRAQPFSLVPEATSSAHAGVPRCPSYSIRGSK